MALTGMAIYKNLPKTNCKECGFPTCMAFAMQVASKQKALTDCPHLSDNAKTELSDASAPPMKLVSIGPAGNSEVKIGQETVMFRHEEKFHYPPALAVKIPSSMSDNDAIARIEQINKAKFTRAGQDMGVRLAAVEVDGPVDKAVTRVKTILEKSTVPLIIISNNAEVMSSAVKAIADKKPLIYKADETNAEQFIKIAAETKCPLAISADTTEKLADIANSAREKGVTDMVFSFDGKKTAHTIRNITTIRRAALKKNFRTMGFPVMVDISMDNAMKETALAATFSAKYAGIIIINGVDGSELLPILTTIQNIYTDPQVPNTVEAKLYEIGHVSQDSPVLFTTNFSLTYFCVEGEVERSKVPCYICVVDTEGLGVLNAYAGDKLSPEKVIKTLASQNVSEKVKHRKLIIPGLLPSFRAELEDTSEWKEVMIGPENASGIPVFLTQNWKK